MSEAFPAEGGADRESSVRKIRVCPVWREGSVIAKKRSHLPEPGRRGFFLGIERYEGWIEDIVEPPHRLLEALVLAQLAGDKQGHVEKEFPVIMSIGIAVFEFDIFLWKVLIDP